MSDLINQTNTTPYPPPPPTIEQQTLIEIQLSIDCMEYIVYYGDEMNKLINYVDYSSIEVGKTIRMTYVYENERGLGVTLQIL